ILDQLRSIGVSCDWKRCRFTLEEKLSQAVIQAFVTLHEQGYIYRGHRMVRYTGTQQDRQPWPMTR
ncbi:MAG: class I tRNA ligase family protein, partial [Bacteroidota bacterium]